MMKRSFFTLALGAALALSTAAEAKTLPIGKLPKGTLTAAPPSATPPTSVAATSKVDGFHVQTRTYSNYYAHVRSSADPDAKDDVSVCYAEPNNQNWVPDELRLYAYTPVASVRAQRITPRGKKGASLVITDAWVDTTTGGVQLIAEHEVKMAHMATASTGVKVFAARDPKEEMVHFLVRRAPKPKTLDASLIQTSLFGFQQILTFQNQSFAQSTCDWMAVSMKRKRGRGTTATVRSDVALRAAPRDELVRGVRFLEVRIRPQYAHLSLTKSSKDKHAVASVSFGWAGRGSTQQLPMREQSTEPDPFRDREFQFDGG